MLLFKSVCLVFGILLHLVWSIPIDNGVEGDPEIECAASSITINFNVRNNFEGKVYVRGHAGEDGCFSKEGGRKVAGLTLPFTACGVERSRSLNPRGIFVTTNIVVSFHPQFLTKVDRAYTVQCFYMEAEKTVSQQIEVSELSTLFQSQIAPMPVCRYDILDNGPTGQPIKFAILGQQVYHKWTCETETTDIFCMIVHSCFVSDGGANRAQILDDKGCGLDKHILQNLEYTTDLMAGRESHVFKFADAPGLFFQCQISVTTKEPGGQCPRPQCGEPPGISAGVTGGLGVAPPAGGSGVAPPAKIGGTAPPARPATATAPPPATIATIRPVLRNRTRLRYFDSPFSRKIKRSAEEAPPSWREDQIGVWDVSAQRITTLDVDETENPFGKAPQATTRSPFSFLVKTSTESTDYCLSTPAFSVLLSVTGLLIVLSTSLSILFCRTKHNAQK